MKNVQLIKIGTIIFTSSLLLAGCGGGDSTTLNETSNELSRVEIDGLLFMREEEELARDLYLDIYDAKDGRLNTFKNISDNAETKHAEAIRVLLEKYGIEDPSTGSRNTYTDPELQDLYDNLINIAVGSDDLGALRVGAMVEETDIRDINTIKAQVSSAHQEIIDTYDNLLCGSRNHLRAFVKQIEKKTNVAYVTQVPELDSIVQDILSSEQEKCGK